MDKTVFELVDFDNDDYFIAYKNSLESQIENNMQFIKKQENKDYYSLKSLIRRISNFEEVLYKIKIDNEVIGFFSIQLRYLSNEINIIMLHIKKNEFDFFPSLSDFLINYKIGTDYIVKANIIINNRKVKLIKNLQEIGFVKMFDLNHKNTSFDSYYYLILNRSLS